MLGALLLFSIGSALAGPAHSLNSLIAGRGECRSMKSVMHLTHPLKAVQGVGGGALSALVQIILADLVSLRDLRKLNCVDNLGRGQ